MLEGLFEPLAVGAMTARNRVFMAPLTRNRARRDGVPGPLAATYYAQRAGAGLIVTEATQVSRQGQGYAHTPGIFTDDQVAGWREVTDAVHRAGGLVASQLWHVGRISHPSLQPGGALPVAPSAIRPEGATVTYEGQQPFVTPRALESGEIAAIVEDYRRAAVKARDAGFDAVEVHGANGYLLDQFLADGANRREDGYGGSPARRARLLLEVVDAVVSVWGRDRVGVRLSPLGTFNSIDDSDREATYGQAIEALDGRKLAYLHVVEAFGQDLDAAQEALLRRLRARWRGVLVANGGYDGGKAAAAVADGHADAVAFGVPFIANPDLPARLREGAPLAQADRATFYGGDARGYTDYGFLPRTA